MGKPLAPPDDSELGRHALRRIAEPREATAQAIRLLADEKPAPPALYSDRLITAEEAAEIARVPVGRVYDWSRKQRWAHRPTRRTLRIDEAGFRKWLAAR